MKSEEIIAEAKKFRKNDKVEINGEEFLVFDLEQDVWFDSKKGKLIENYPKIFMYKLPVDKNALIPLWYVLKIVGNEIKFAKEIKIENSKDFYPEDFPEKSKTKFRTEAEEIEIKTLRKIE